MSEQRDWIEQYGLKPTDPGFIYIIQSGKRYKIGRSKSKSSRMAAAKTWLPEMRIVGVKPFWNVSAIERFLHLGFARCWHSGEWYQPADRAYRTILLDGFVAFSDHDMSRNSVDFIYWFNGEGMTEFVTEHERQGLSIRAFLANETEFPKN